MTIIYKTESGQEFTDKEKALAFDELKTESVTYTEKRTVKFIPATELKKIFDIGIVWRMSFYIEDETGDIKLDGDYETNQLDKSGHLHCTDLNHGLFEWDEKEQSYYRTLYGHSWKVKLLGFKHITYD